MADLTTRVSKNGESIEEVGNSNTFKDPLPFPVTSMFIFLLTFNDVTESEFFVK
jgi:hypothetical protein